MDENLKVSPHGSNTRVSSRFFYFDQNRRVYEMNGIRKNSPYHECYFVPIKVLSENEKEIICEYGTIKKKTMEYHCGRVKYKVYTEQQKNDDVYVQENRHILAEKVRTLSADKLKLVELILNGCYVEALAMLPIHAPKIINK